MLSRSVVEVEAPWPGGCPCCNSVVCHRSFAAWLYWRPAVVDLRCPVVVSWVELEALLTQTTSHGSLTFQDQCMILGSQLGKWLPRAQHFLKKIKG